MSTKVVLSRQELVVLKHDLNGSLAVLDGFLSELDDAVNELSDLPRPIEAGSLDGLLEDDFRPCLNCLGTALARLRDTVERFDATSRAA